MSYPEARDACSVDIKVLNPVPAIRVHPRKSAQAEMLPSVQAERHEHINSIDSISPVGERPAVPVSGRP